MPDVESLAFGIYVEDEIRTADGRFSLTPGVRFDWYEHEPQETSDYTNGPNFDGTMPDGASDSQLSPKLRATRHALTELDVSGQWAQLGSATCRERVWQHV